MRNIIAILFFFAIVIPPHGFGRGDFDIEEYGSVDEFSAAVLSHIQRIHKSAARPGPKMRVAVIPVKSGRAGTASGIIRGIGISEDLSALDPATAAGFLRDKRQAGQDVLFEMIKTLELDAVVTVREYPSDEKQLVIARIFLADDLRAPVTLAGLIPVFGSGGGIEGPFLRDPGAWTASPDIPVAARYFVKADLDSDRRAEYVFSDSERLYVYRLEPSGWSEVWAEPGSGITGAGRHIALYAADIKKSGRPEIFVTYMEGGKVWSKVLDFKDKIPRLVARLSGFLRPVHRPGGGVVLIGQEYSEIGFYKDRPHEYIWNGVTYTQGPEFPLPKDVALYGFSFAEFGEYSPLLVAISDRDRLRVYSHDTLVWESRERYGAVETVAVEPEEDVYNFRSKVRPKGRVAVIDLDADGRDEIILPRNVGAGIFTDAKGAEMHGLSWAGARLEQVMLIKGLPGPVLDFDAASNAEGSLEITALVEMRKGIFSRPVTRLFTYIDSPAGQKTKNGT